MKLRYRLTLAAFAGAAPIALVLLVVDARAQHAAAEEMLTAFVAASMPGEQPRCEAAPEVWGGRISPEHFGPFGESFVAPPELHGGGATRPTQAWGSGVGPPDPMIGHAEIPVVFAYGPDLRSQNPSAPRLAPSLLAQLAETGGRSVALPWRTSAVEVLVRMPKDSGPCAFILGQGTLGGWGAILPDQPFWLLPTIVVFCAIVAASGTVVRRIQRLTDFVKRPDASMKDAPRLMEGDDEVSELARAFHAARTQIRGQLEELARRERALRDFVSNTTHDVTLPLTVLQGHLTTLRDLAVVGEAPSSAVVGSAMNEAHYLASLVHNLGAVARLDGIEHAPPRHPVDLGALVMRVQARHHPIARASDVALDSAVPAKAVWASADVTLLEQAVSNIVYNAVRYNKPGGHVAILLEAAERSFRLRVVDDGPGIAPENLTKLATRGVRGDDSRTRAPDGQGLGLSIAFRAAELHGYRLAFGPSEFGGLCAELAGDCVVGSAPAT